MTSNKKSRPGRRLPSKPDKRYTNGRPCDGRPRSECRDLELRIGRDIHGFTLTVDGPFGPLQYEAGCMPTLDPDDPVVRDNASWLSSLTGMPRRRILAEIRRLHVAQLVREAMRA